VFVYSFKAELDSGDAAVQLADEVGRFVATWLARRPSDPTRVRAAAWMMDWPELVPVEVELAVEVVREA
jgi:hypothetical protein